MHSPEISDKSRILEIVFVLLTGMGKFIFMDWLNWRFAFITTACLFWIGYVLWKAKKSKRILVYWGFNRNNFRRTFLEILPFAVLCVIVFIIIGNKQETNILIWKIVPILAIYPIWGIIQQFIIVGLIAKNLKDMKSVEVPDLVIILITAVVFAIVHYPSPLLVIGTFFLAIIYTTLYLRNRNLIVLGIFHGWLGAFFYYTILGRDAFLEVFGASTL